MKPNLANETLSNEPFPACEEDTCSHCAFVETTETLSANNGKEALARETSEYLARVVAAGLTTLVALRPYIEELWRRFDALKLGETIHGCRTQKDFCESVLHRDPRTVRY